MGFAFGIREQLAWTVHVRCTEQLAWTVHVRCTSICGVLQAKRLEQARKRSLSYPPVLLGRWAFSEWAVSPR
jgi:hypothetical protein